MTDVQTEKERKETDTISHLLPSNHVGMIMRWAVRKGIICWKMSRFMIDRPGERYPLAFPCICMAAAQLLQDVCNLKCLVFTFWMHYMIRCVEFIYLIKFFLRSCSVCHHMMTVAVFEEMLHTQSLVSPRLLYMSITAELSTIL